MTIRLLLSALILFCFVGAGVAEENIVKVKSDFRECFGKYPKDFEKMCAKEIDALLRAEGVSRGGDVVYQNGGVFTYETKAKLRNGATVWMKRKTFNNPRDKYLRENPEVSNATR